MSTDAPSQNDGSAMQERRLLSVALGLNATMFVVGLLAGLLGQSLGLVADSLDMLADALAYGLSLLAVGRPAMFKARVARMSGVLLMILGLGVVVDVVRRIFAPTAPDPGIIVGTAMLSLVVNAMVLRMLAKLRRGEVHVDAAWLFTRADVVANLGVIASGLLVLFTGSRYPDLLVGFVIGAYVIREAAEILRRARRAAEGAAGGASAP